MPAYRSGVSVARVHLSPCGASHDLQDADPAATFGYVARELDRRGLEFLFVREPSRADTLRPEIKRAFGGMVIGNDGYDADAAQDALESGTADALAFAWASLPHPTFPSASPAKQPGTLSTPRPSTAMAPCVQKFHSIAKLIIRTILGLKPILFM